MVSILGRKRFPILEKFWVEIELENGDVLTTCQAGLVAGSGFWLSELARGRIAVELTLKHSPNPSGVLIAATIRNRGESPLVLRQVRLVRTAFGQPHVIEWGPLEGWKILRMGYTFGGAHREDQDPRNSALIALTGERVQTRSWGQAVVKFAGTGGLVLGFLTSHRQMTWIDFRKDRGELELAAVCETEGVVIEPGGALETETLYIGLHGDALKGLTQYAVQFGRQMNVKLKPVPAGWCSWYFYRKQNVTEDIQLEHARFLAGRRESLPLSVVQLDDGYQTAYGDWLDTNERFPHGLEWLAGQIAALGCRPGLWLAPFVAQASSKLFKEHPAWMVKDGAGNPLAWEVDWAEPHEPWYALDGSHPEVQQWLTQLFATLRQFGYRYFKLDFLFLGCLKGVHAQPVTRVEAYRQGLRAIRKGVGGAYLLGCTAPYQPSVGLVDGMRASHDIHPGGDLWEGFREAARETHQRFWAHRTLWNTDHDVIVVRAMEGVTEETSRALAASVELSGGALFASDPLPALPPERLDLLARTLKAAHVHPAVPVDMFVREHPRVLALPLGRRRFRVGVFNLTGVSRSTVVDLSWLGLTRATVSHLDGIRPKPIGRVRKQFLTPPIPPRGVIMLLIEGI